MDATELSVIPVTSDIEIKNGYQAQLIATYTEVTKTVTSEELVTESKTTSGTCVKESESNAISQRTENDIQVKHEDENKIQVKNTPEESLNVVENVENDVVSNKNSFKRIKDVRFSLPDILVNYEDASKIQKSVSFEDKISAKQTTEQIKVYTNQAEPELDKSADPPIMVQSNDDIRELAYDYSSALDPDTRNDTDNHMHMAEMVAFGNKEKESRERSYFLEWEKEELNEVITDNVTYSVTGNNAEYTTTDNTEVLHSNSFTNLIHEENPRISSTFTNNEIQQNIVSQETKENMSNFQENQALEDLGNNNKREIAVQDASVLDKGQIDEKIETITVKDQVTQTEEKEYFRIEEKAERMSSSSSSILPSSKDETVLRKGKRSLPFSPIRNASNFRKFKNNENIHNWFYRNDSSQLSNLTLRGRYPDISYIDEPYYVTRSWQNDDPANLPYYPFFEKQAMRTTYGLNTKPLLRKIYLPARNDFKKTTLGSYSGMNMFRNSTYNQFAGRRIRMQYSNRKKQSGNMLHINKRLLSSRKYGRCMIKDSGVLIFIPEEDTSGCCQQKNWLWPVSAILSAFVIVIIVCTVILIISL